MIIRLCGGLKTINLRAVFFYYDCHKFAKFISKYLAYA